MYEKDVIESGVMIVCKDKNNIKDYAQKYTLSGNYYRFYFDDNNELYISIKDLSNLLQKNKIMAEYNNGRYEEYNEDTTKCYIKQNFETNE